MSGFLDSFLQRSTSVSTYDSYFWWTKKTPYFQCFHWELLIEVRPPATASMSVQEEEQLSCVTLVSKERCCLLSFSSVIFGLFEHHGPNVTELLYWSEIKSLNLSKSHQNLDGVSGNSDLLWFLWSAPLTLYSKSFNMSVFPFLSHFSEIVMVVLSHSWGSKVTNNYFYQIMNAVFLTIMNNIFMIHT